MAKTKDKPEPSLKDDLEAQQKAHEEKLAAAAKVDVCEKCDMRGHGGRYIYDVETGKRKRIAGPKIEVATNKQGGGNK